MRVFVGPELKDKDEALMTALAPTIEKLYRRHLNTSKTWYPDDFIEAGYAARSRGEYEDVELPEAVKSSLFVGLLTEDNLPYYYASKHDMTPKNHPFRAWATRWTAEEGRHSIAMRGWMAAARIFNPHMLEDARMKQVTDGVSPILESFADGIFYPKLQEPATKISHRESGNALPRVHAIGKKLMKTIARDESNHGNFYDDLADKAFEIDRSSMVIAAARQIINFAMPGTGIINFEEHAKAIANADIFNYVHLYDQVFVPAVRKWNIEHLTGLNHEAEIARTALIKHMRRLNRFVQRRKNHNASQAELVTA